MARYRRRVLFVSEAVTLAQVVRLVVLARSLPPAEYEVHFAAAAFDHLVFAGTDFRRWRIHSLAPALVDRRVRRGARIYSGAVLRRYLADDLRVLDLVRPDVVVGDLRLSLAVAAPLRGIPHAALINAYWSPHAARAAWPLPDHPIVRLLGEARAARHFARALPWVFDHFARPVNRLRRAHGLAAIGSLPDVLCHGDRTLYPDPAALVPTPTAPSSHVHLGPVLWSPAIAPPPWWSRLDPARPTAYVTLGSSGRAELLPRVLEVLAARGVQALVATAGRVEVTAPPPHVHVAGYLPGDRAAARADFVISNGGSTTSYQALAAGRPVLGLASNLDQCLAMSTIAQEGAGLMVRAGAATPATLDAAVARLLEDASFATRARARAPLFATAPGPPFRTVLEALIAGRGAPEMSAIGA